VAPGFAKLRRVGDIHQAVLKRLFLNMTMQGRHFQIAAQECKDVRVVILDGVGA
jgi:hypothetical protein